MIQVIGGDQGSGKSLYACWLIEQAWRKGERIATNIELTPQHPAYADVYYIGEGEYPILDQDRGLAFFNHMPRRTRYIIDEADIWFDSEDWGKLKGPMKWYLKQQGKRGDNVHLIVQDFANLWVKARRLCHEWCWCYRDGPLGSMFGGVTGWLLPSSFQQFRRSTFKQPDMKPFQHIRDGSMSIEQGEKMYGWYITEQEYVGLDW